jgi:hypothetical protein
LDPGEPPKIHGVNRQVKSAASTLPETKQELNRYPAQEHVGGDSKIPSVLYYDADGNVAAVRIDMDLLLHIVSMISISRLERRHYSIL